MSRKFDGDGVVDVCRWEYIVDDACRCESTTTADAADIPFEDDDETMIHDDADADDEMDEWLWLYMRRSGIYEVGWSRGEVRDMLR
jgi:hypothetical protein